MYVCMACQQVNNGKGEEGRLDYHKYIACRKG